MERLWSYLRRFSKSTKEMRPSHRIDVITSALLHYAARIRLNIGNALYEIAYICYRQSFYISVYV